jgi:hypothetical protein
MSKTEIKDAILLWLGATSAIAVGVAVGATLFTLGQYALTLWMLGVL